MPGQSRTIEPGFHWIQEPGPNKSRFATEDYDESPDWYDPEDTLHVAQNAYLLTDEQSLLFDTLSPASTDVILDELEALLEDGLDYLVVSHPDVPHAGNTGPILEAYPDATLVGPGYGNAHELYHLEDAQKVRAGDQIDLGRFEVTFHKGTFPDAPVHVWMSEERTGTLFPVDWLGYPHRGAEILQFPDEVETDVTVDRLVQFHGRVLFWFQYVDVGTVQETIDQLIKLYDPDLVAPSHGNPIREDPVEIMEDAKDVVAQVKKRGRVGTLG